LISHDVALPQSIVPVHAVIESHSMRQGMPDGQAIALASVL